MDGHTTSDYNSTVEPFDLEIGGLCTIFEENPHYCDIIIAVRRATACISLIGCLFMISVMWLFRRYLALAQRLILYLSIGALLDCVAYLMGGLHPDGPLCNFQGFWLTYFDWTVLLWVSCITFNLYMNVVRATETEKFEWVYHLVCCLLPLLMSSLPFIGDNYGPAGAWCWIVENWKWRVGIWYGPLFAIIALLFVTYIYIVITLSRKASTWEGTYDPDTERNKQMLKEDIKPLRGYPFVYLAVSIFPLVNRIQNAISSGNPVFTLVLLASISSPLHGALNAIVFGMDRSIFQQLTPSQIKVAVQSHFYRGQEIREYPVTYRSSDIYGHTSQDFQVPRYNHVSYSKLC
ncbi:cyclic AMP receptor-like protein A [Octopus sinensis]|uniref:Cyclic AMP receptor-like protein A n=1 Tax=Octopus sinensis TaxID=2607531 RepID=A0A6P7TB59_9MOLL|nr:cyclic AMP receptor-like protein A [Octopus sinensis]